MDKVENGLFVSVEYKGTLGNGEVFDTSQGTRPLEVKMGAGRLIKGFENALMGMSLNEKKTFTLQPEEAYGNRDEELKTSIPRKEIPPGANPQVGQTVTLTSPEGQQIPGRIAEVNEEAVTIDLNHPLAGESLTFEVEVVGINNEPAHAEPGCSPSCDCSSGCH
ncbi:MAG: peptidylprolyl isomerase [Deltaproteobacteria bacterium HGW-Deltaproteobacteria-21]|nr:MAG: peptidylprolyl isomerase [Deltaproteobacteria bacterium HGW-Deltaproteobacteria-21]